MKWLIIFLLIFLIACTTSMDNLKACDEHCVETGYHEGVCNFKSEGGLDCVGESCEPCDCECI